ncbi:hypothetical protein ASC90_26310 [Rhizobium sp. Root1220]|nr:hypothetical protein ASC90_26310 [Rhizobium sp. Root1220]
MSLRELSPAARRPAPKRAGLWLKEEETLMAKQALKTEFTGTPADQPFEKSRAARCGFLVEGAEAAFLPVAVLSGRTVGFDGCASSANGAAPSHRMIASRPGRSCFFNSAVSSASIPQA